MAEWCSGKSPTDSVGPPTWVGEKASSHRATSSASTAPTPRGGGMVAAPPAPAPGHTDSTEEGDRRRDKPSRSGTQERLRSPSRERRSRRHCGSRQSRSRYPPSRWPQHVDSYYGDQYMRNPMTSPAGPLFQYGATYGYLPAHSGVATPTPTYQSHPPALGHSLLPSPGNGKATYPSPANTPQS